MKNYQKPRKRPRSQVECDSGKEELQPRSTWRSKLTTLNLLHPSVTPRTHSRERPALPYNTPQPQNSSHNIRSSLSENMASQELKQRIRDDTNTAAAMDGKRKMGGKIRDERMAMAKRGLRSLTIAVSVPLSLSLLSAYLGSSKSHAYVDSIASRKPFWFPPMWALHLTCPASSFLMGLAAWMVWANGGFHRHPNALLLYLAQLLLTLLWDPLVFGAGATRIGLVLCFGMFGAMVGCYRLFGQVNPISGDLIKPCLAWAAFLSIVNLKLLFV